MPKTFRKALSFLTVLTMSVTLVTGSLVPAFADDADPTTGATATEADSTSSAAITSDPEITSEPAIEEPVAEPVPVEGSGVAAGPEFETPILISAPAPAPVVSEFADVTDHWAAASIDFVVRNGVFSGVGDGKFDPNGVLTRGMLVTVLGRYENISTAAAGNSNFIDVAASQYYSPYVAWAAINGIAAGTGNSLFEPDAIVTREQAAKIIASYIRFSSKIPRSTRIYKPPFSDADRISTWALEDVNLIRSYGLLEGRPDGNFDPTGSLTRAEASVILKRFIENAPKSTY
ncbi:hypothetical protein FACS1894127_0980 [Clostridia bacterium]|nr:hypothetical protein FACS1894127_0980 [Clostridia bacterium]